MRRPGVVLLLGALLGALGIWVAAPAQACDCSSGTTVQNAERADAVFIGRLVSREPGTRPPHVHPASSPPAVHLFEVDTVIKGQVLQQQEVLSPWDGSSCGMGLPPGGGPVAVFATSSADLGSRPFAVLEPGQYASFLCDGNAPLTPALEAELESLPDVGPPSEPLAGLRSDPAPSGGSDDRTIPVLAGAAALAALGGAFVVRRRRGTGGGA